MSADHRSLADAYSRVDLLNSQLAALSEDRNQLLDRLDRLTAERDQLAERLASTFQTLRHVRNALDALVGDD